MFIKSLIALFTPYDQDYMDYSFARGLTRLRVVFVVLILLYGLFGYFDSLLIDEFLTEFLIIRFAVVIPLFLITLGLSYHPIFRRIGQLMLLINLVVGGAGISVMLILYPDNISYYGGSFMVIFAGDFLIGLNTRFAVFGGLANMVFYVSAYTLYHQDLHFDVFIMLAFYLGANVIGGLGNYQMEQMSMTRYLQEKEIHKKNRLLEARVSNQHRVLMQVQKAVESTSDAIAIHDREGAISYQNRAHREMAGYTLKELNTIWEPAIIYEDPEQLKKIFTAVLCGGAWKGEQIIKTKDDRKIMTLMQVDAVKDDKGKIIGVITTHKDITERKQADQQVLFLSYHDQLTCLFNRRFYEEEKRRVDSGENMPISLIMLDVNGLKLANDAFGHLFGDRILQLAAAIISREIRAADIAARIGGDEFVVLLPQCDHSEVEAVARRIIHATSTARIESLELSVSLGWSTKSEPDEAMDELFKRAEDNMYQRKLYEGPSMRGHAIKTIAQTMFEKIPGEKEHSDRVGSICESIGRAMGLSSDGIAEIRTVGMLHDIGKISLDQAVLNKPGGLTHSEWSEIKRHPEIGYRILSTVNEMALLAEYTLSHHENWDGTGYPRGLRGKDIPLQARIIRIADAYDAMISERSYKKALTHQEAIQEIAKYAGIQFDPSLANFFIDRNISFETVDKPQGGKHVQLAGSYAHNNHSGVDEEI